MTYSLFNVHCFAIAGWGNLVFFDTEEHEIPNETMTLAQIPKLGSQWRIIHDFKPTDYLQSADPRLTPPLSLGVVMEDKKKTITIRFAFPRIVLAHVFLNENNQHQTQYDVESRQRPKVGEWTRMEIGHQKVDDKYFLSLSVGGREVGRKQVADPDLRKPTDVKVVIGSKNWQSGFIRRLVILEN